MRILGLNHDMYISSAALIEDGRIIAAAPEERFMRAKLTRDFPANAIRFCLKEAGCRVKDTGRVQTVDKETNPRFYALIQEFKRIAGVPLLLNTSFNLNGEPIVCTPTDAIRTFYSCGLDVLVMGKYVVWKDDSMR